MQTRIVITGVGLTSPLGNDLASMRSGLLAGTPAISLMTPRYLTEWPAGFCD